MRRNMNVALISLGLLLGTAGCNSFLTGERLSTNPNFPGTASIEPLFIGTQAGQFAFQEGTVAMMMCEWVQACSATNSRFVQQAAQYVFGESSNIGANGGDWISVYAGGCLTDIRQVETLARARGDSIWLGIAKIWEALTIGTASDMWGDIPYSEAGVKPQPVLDNRFVILNALQTLLGEAIAELGNGSGAGPGGNDLVFGGDPDKWIAAAWTLKARYYMHTAESLGTPAYQNAITAALNGISDPTGASDFSSFHGTKTAEWNMWAQFQILSGFGGDLEAGKALVDFMNGRRDPRLPSYFCQSVSATWKKTTAYKLTALVVDSVDHLQEVTTAGTSGSTEPTWATATGATTTDGTVTWTNRGPPYGGDDYTTPPTLPISLFDCQPARFANDARIPYVSYTENELILAEAYSATGNDGNALTHLQNEIDYVNATYASPQAPKGLAALPAASGSGAALLAAIMNEKWVATFQNIESINDYRRTCIPNLTPSANSQGFTNVPGRLFYPLNERNTNPNVPDPTVQQATHGFRNAGDVHGCKGDLR